MIPKIVHYCWFGRGEMPQQEKDCLASWHEFMPDWDFILWNEDNFDVNSVPYVKEAYEAKKYAFVSDYVRLFALSTTGGLYLDTDVMVFKPFDPLLEYDAFIGYEGSKKCPLGTCVIGSMKNGQWVTEQLARYENRHFITPDGSYDTTTNVVFITSWMVESGLICDGKEKDMPGIHILPVTYFSPRQTTGEYFRTDNTFSDHLGACSWSKKENLPFLLKYFGPGTRIKLIKLKRKILG